MEISDSVKLFGTDEPVESMQALIAGPLSVSLDRGALRYINIDSVEAIRNIDFVVRDKDWGTYATDISNLEIDQHTDGFSVSYDASCGDESQQLTYKVSITGKSDGTLSIAAQCFANTDFVTNRAGFVILHPIKGVAGEPISLEKVDGQLVQSTFPSKIDPIQPHKDIRAITHQIQPGRSMRCEMIGDTFEMEDQRQWNDASFKTYVRPLSEPWPYTLAAKQSFDQAVNLSLIDDRNGVSVERVPSVNTTVIKIGSLQRDVTVPHIGLGMEPQHLQSALELPENTLKQLRLNHLVNWHCIGEHNERHLQNANKIAKAANANVHLQVVIPDTNYQSEIADLASQCKASGLSPAAVTVSPAIYLKSLMPTNPWPEVSSLGDIYQEARQHFPKSLIGGGMLSFFPELNRHRPPIEQLDFVTHASNVITHASDDITVTENLETLPHIFDSCRSFIHGKPYHLGPSSIGMRFNPYGSNTIDNPNNIRIAMARIDPRHRGLLNAAWTLGYIAHAARGQIDTVTMHALTGEFGVFYSQQAWPQPGFDETDRLVFPVYHVIAGIAAASGKNQYETESTNSREVEVFAYNNDGQQCIWIANLSNKQLQIEIQGVNHQTMDISTISVQSWDSCTRDSHGFDQTRTQITLPKLVLDAYAVVRLSAD